MQLKLQHRLQHFLSNSKLQLDHQVIATLVGLAVRHRIRMLSIFPLTTRHTVNTVKAFRTVRR